MLCTIVDNIVRFDLRLRKRNKKHSSKCWISLGIWSPSGTPQPVRRAISSTETGQYKSEPSLVQSTPSTPAAERRDFRSVKFESPIASRKNLVTYIWRKNEKKKKKSKSISMQNKSEAYPIRKLHQFILITSPLSCYRASRHIQVVHKVWHSQRLPYSRHHHRQKSKVLDELKNGHSSPFNWNDHHK